jgi:hypothetical protein
MAIAGYAVVAGAVVGRDGVRSGKGRAFGRERPDGDWDNEVAEHGRMAVGQRPPGTPLMSSRLYFSQVYFLTGGAYPITRCPRSSWNRVPQAA